MLDQKTIQSFDKDILKSILDTKDPIAIKNGLAEYGLEIVDKKIQPMKQYVATYESSQAYWDRQQLVKKINLE